MAKLESLLVDLQLSSAALKAGLKDAAEDLKSFGEKVKELDEKLHALSEAKSFEIGKEVVEGLTEFVQKGAEAAAQMGIMARMAGTSTEAFSRLSYAANVSGLSTEDLASVFRKLNQNIAQAGAGLPQQAAIFQGLGITVKDSAGKVKSSSAIFSELAGVFNGMTDGASKARLEAELLGKSGAKLDIMFKGGAEGLAALGDEGERFGVVVGPAAAEAAHEFESNIARLQLAMNAVGQQAAISLTPALSEITTKLLGSKEGTDALKGAAELLANVMRVFASAVVIAGGVLNGLGIDLAFVGAAMDAVAHGNFGAALEMNNDRIKAVDASSRSAGEALKAIWSSAVPVTEKATEATKKNADAVLANVESTKKALELAKQGWLSLTSTLEGFIAKETEAAVGENWLDKINAQLSTGKIGKELSEIGSRAAAMKQELQDALIAVHEFGLERLSLKVDFDIKRTAAQTATGSQQRTTDFSQAGLSAEDVRAQQEAGFAGFNQALDAWARQLDVAARKTADYELAKFEGDTEGAEAAQLASDKAKSLAEQAGKAADAFKTDQVSFTDLARESQALNFSLGQLSKTTDLEVTKRTLAYNKIGSTGFSADHDTKGFASFDEAMSQYAIQTQRNALLLDQAQLEMKAGHVEAAQELTDFAREAKEGAGVAGEALDAFAAQATEARTKLLSSIEGIGSDLNSKMGQLGEIINAGFAGFKSGGIWGAIGAVLIDIFSKFQRFQELVDFGTEQLTDFIDQLKSGFSALVDGLKPLMVAMGEMTQTVGEVLNPIFQVLGTVLGTLGKILTPITAMIHTAIQPIMTLVTAFTSIGEAITPLDAVIKAVSAIFNFVAVTILGVINVVEMAWSGILSLVIDIIKAVGGNYTDEAKLLASNQANVAAGQAKIKDIWAHITDPNANADIAAPDPGEFGAQVKDLGGTWKDATSNVTDLGASAGAASSKFSEMLTNLPSGYKIGAAVFGATSAVGGGAGQGVLPVSAQPLNQAASSLATTAAQWAKSVGDLLYGKDLTGRFNKDGTVAKGNFTGIDPSAGTGTDMWGGGNPGAQWTLDQLAAYTAAYTAAKAAGATDEQAVQAGTLAANASRGSSSSAATAAVSGGSGGGIHSVGSAPATTEFHFHGPIYPKSFPDFVKQISDMQSQQTGQRRRNPFKVK